MTKPDRKTLFRQDYRIKAAKNGIRIRFEDRGRGIHHFFESSSFDTPEKLLAVIYNLSGQVWSDRSLLHSFLWLAENDFGVDVSGSNQVRRELTAGSGSQNRKRALRDGSDF